MNIKFKDKTAGLQLDIAKPKSNSSANAESSKTAIGLHASAIYRDQQLSEENHRLKGELIAFEGSEPTKRLDPKKIRASHWANRHADSFLRDDFIALREEIASSGGNVQPIKVRAVPTQGGVGEGDEYEVIFGHRRHRACLELGLPVLAVIESVDDRGLFIQMDRENRNREDLRPYEQGVMYSRAIKDGLFPSIRALAREVGADAGGVSRLVALAELPPEVLAAFASPLDIQFDWATPLAQAVATNLTAVVAVATEISSRDIKPSAKDALKLLVLAATPATPSGQDAFVPVTETDLPALRFMGTKGRSAGYEIEGDQVVIRLSGASATSIKKIAGTIRKALEG